MIPQRNGWDKLSDNLNSRWRNLFDSLTVVGGAPHSLPAGGRGSVSKPAVSGADGIAVRPANLVITMRVHRAAVPGTPSEWTIMASRNERAEQLYLAVKAARAADRTSLLARYCADDPELKREVQDMLDKDDRLGSFMEHPPLGLLNKVMNEVPTITDDGAGEPRPPRPPEGRLANGLVLNKRFVIVRYIAKGGMGEVYEAEDQLLQDSHIALKTILPEIDSHRGFQLRFEHEVLAAREVVHPNLCPIYHIERCDEPPLGFLFLTMKLLPGETLAARLRRTGPLPKEEGLAVARQMADGLLAIHAARVVHRDIKSTNVMLDGSGNDVRLWITDFGLARALKADPSFSGKPTLAGTPGYIAPELYRGQPASRASDLYAFGVVLHEVFTGERPPEKGDGVPVTPGARLSAAGVPSPCADLIKGCLDDDPARRCAAFDEALEPLGLKRPQKRKWTRRQFAGMATAAACSFAAVGWLERDPLYNATHPLPARRFVALLPWPKTSDNNVAPMLTGVLTAIKGELSRLEAFDRNLFVISPEDVNQDLSKAAHLKDVCDPLGANLALAAAGGSNKNQFALTLRLIDPATSHSVREKRLTCALNETPSLPSRAVDAAASLLNLGRYLKTSERTESGTHSTQAYTAFQSAETLMKQPNYSGLAAGIEKYKEALDLDPHYVLAFAKLSEAYTRQYAIQRDPAALDLASANSERALDLDPQLVEGHLARAFVLQYSGDEQGALGELSRCLTLDPSNPGAMLWQAVIYARLNRWSDAEKAYRRVLKERPNSWITYTELGSLYHDQGRFQEAIQAFRDASAAAPASALPLSDLGVEYLQTGDFAAAAETLKKCLALAPDSDDVVVNVSLALRYQGKYEEALPYAMKAVQVNPKNDTNWLELGECYSSLRNKQSEARNAYSRAAKEAEQHLKTDQTDGPSWMLLALYRVKSGEPQSALSLIRKAESLGAADMDSQLYKARILNLLGKRDDSLATLKTCFEKGAGDLQMIPFPDMQDLRRDPRYQQMLRSQSKADRSGFLPTSSESSIHFGA